MRTRDLGPDDLPRVAALVASCLAVDGGLPMASDAPLVRSMYLSGPARGWLDGDELVAAGGVHLDADGAATAAGCVAPGGAGTGSAARCWAGPSTSPPGGR